MDFASALVCVYFDSWLGLDSFGVFCFSKVMSKQDHV